MPVTDDCVRVPLVQDSVIMSKLFGALLLIFSSGSLNLLLGPRTTAGQLVETVATGLEIVVHTIESIGQAWEFVESSNLLKPNHNDVDVSSVLSKKHKELMGRLVEIYRAIENIEYEAST